MNDEAKEKLLDCFALEAMKSLFGQTGKTQNPYRVADLSYDVAKLMLERREIVLSQWGLDKEALQKTNEEIERDHIDKLCLTVRAQNCLEAEGIITITQLQKCTENRLLRIPNLGRKSLEEIIEQMDAHGYKLKDYI